VMGGSRSDAGAARQVSRGRRSAARLDRRRYLHDVRRRQHNCIRPEQRELSGGALTGRWPEWRRQRGPLLPRS
jgi:hypothetical protein